MRLIKLLLTIGLALVAGWSLFEGLRNIYYSNYFIGGILLFQTVPILALVIGYWLAPGQESHPESAGRFYKGKSLKFVLGVALVVWLVLTGTLFPALWRPQLREYGRAQPPWLAAWLAPSLSGRLVFATFDGIQVINNDGSLTQLSPSENDRDILPVWSPDGQRIAFIAVRADNRALYVINADGSDLTRLTEGFKDETVQSLSFGWSPDGGRIAFIAERDDNRALYVINADGRDLTRLTENFEDETVRWLSFGWSPDGSRLAVVLDYRDNDHPAFYVINANGSAQTRLAEDPVLGTAPQWSPDGSRLAFISYRDGHPALYVMNTDGTDQIRLTEDFKDETDRSLSFQWSPDGSRLVVIPDRRGNDHPAFYIINANGRAQTRLAEDPVLGAAPQWSPDGGRLSFISNRDGRPALYVMNADGTDQTRLTENVTLLPAEVTVLPGSHQWSPDGQHIVFAGWPDDQAACPAEHSCSEIYVVTVDGRRQTRLTRTTAANQDPIWSPDGQQIVFISNRGALLKKDPLERRTEIYVMNVDGSRQARLTFNNFQEQALMWAPSSKGEYRSLP